MMTYNRLRYPHLVEKAAQLYMELGSTHKVAEERGYWVSPEGIENMRKAHLGNTREVVEQKRLKREQEAIRNKLGMRKIA